MDCVPDEGQLTVAGIEQRSTIVLLSYSGDYKFVGTERAVIKSNHTPFYVCGGDEALVEFENLRLESHTLPTPSLTLTRKTAIRSCDLVANDGFNVLAHAPTHIHNSALRSRGHGCLHSERNNPRFGVAPFYIFEHNVFKHIGESRCGFFVESFDTLHTEEDNQRANKFFKELLKNNGEILECWNCDSHSCD